ncbi:hypothetical protein Tco_0759098 [Tanacetum coccineum]
MRGKRLLYHREYSDDAHALSRNCAALVKWISINYLYNLDFPRHFISFGYISKHHQKQSEFKLLFVPQTNLQSTSNVFKSFFATGLYGTLIVLEVKTAEKGIVRYKAADSTSAPAKDPVEEPTDKVMVDEQYTEDIPISDEGHILDPEDTDNAHMPKIPDTTTWFRPIPKEERHASPELEWVIPLIDLPEADNNWANAFAKVHQDPDENKLHNKIDNIGSFIRWYVVYLIS